MYNNGGQEGFVEVVENSFTYSATDLVGFLECQHLTSLDRAALSGHLERPERTVYYLDDAQGLIDIRHGNNQLAPAPGRWFPSISSTPGPSRKACNAWRVG